MGLGLLDAERAEHASLAASAAALVQDLIATYKALGGGWDAPTEIAAGGNDDR